MKHRVPFLTPLICLFALLCGCVPDRISLPIDVEVDTGADLTRLIYDTLGYLEEAQALLGEQMEAVYADTQATIAMAIDDLGDFTQDVDRLVGNRMNETIASLSYEIQVQLIRIAYYTEQVRNYALDIIDAIGREARLTIGAATDGMRRTLLEAETAGERWTFHFSQNMIYVVNSIADRSLAVGGVVVGILLGFVWAFSWGRLVYQKNFPGEMDRRRLALGLMVGSLALALMPFLLLVRNVRAAVLVPSGAAQPVDLPKGEPTVWRFEPYPVHLPRPEGDPCYLVVKGARLLSAGSPVVTFGDLNLEVSGRTEDELTVVYTQANAHPQAAGAIVVEFPTPGRPYQASVPVQFLGGGADENGPAATGDQTPETGEPTEGFPISVPPLRSVPLQEAQNRLEVLGLQVGEITEAYDREIEAGRVTGSDPPSGAAVRAGDRVDLQVSLGLLYSVPEVVGKPALVAVAAVKSHLAVGALVDRWGEPAEVEDAGEVLECTPPPGEWLPEGSPVDLVVSLKSDVEVPGLVGADYPTALRLLQEAGLPLAGLFDVNAAPASPQDCLETVARSDPAPGELVRGGTPVDLFFDIFDGVRLVDVVELEKGQAKSKLEALGFVVIIREFESYTVPAGIVIGMSPAAGVCQPVGSAVNLIVSMGPK